MPTKSKPWSELSNKERDSYEWRSRATLICPFSRQPCDELIDPNGPEDNPENIRQCQFLAEENECLIKLFFEKLTGGTYDWGPLGQMLGLALYDRVYGGLPAREHWVDKDGKQRSHPGDWEPNI